MDMLLIMFWAFLLCLCVSVLIITFPATYPRECIKKEAKKIQIISIIVDLTACMVIALLYKAFNFSTILIEIKIAVILIPVIASILFSVFLYYPSARYLVNQNIKDQETMDGVLTCIFKCAYNDVDGSTSALNELKQLQKQEEELLRQYGLFLYLCEYSRQAELPINKKPSESTIKCVLDRCSQVKYDIDSYTPTPFPCIGLILSFAFSTVLTILLSIITIIE